MFETEPSVDQLSADAFEAVVAAAGAWQQAEAFVPTLAVQRGDEGELGYSRHGDNRNIVRYSPEPDPLAKGALAITIITFDAVAGRILDADILLNGEHAFDNLDDSSVAASGAYDMQNVLTHEMGHALGLGEEMEDEEATMYAFSQPGETRKRELQLGDLEAIAELYDEPIVEGAPGGCGGAAISNYRGEPWVLTCLALCGLVLWMRRRESAGLRGGTFAGLLALAAGTGGGSQELVDQRYTVLEANSAWQGSLMVTQLTLQPQGAAEAPVSVEVLGGRVGDIAQQVGHLMPPTAGDSVQVRLDSGLFSVGPIPAQLLGAPLRAEEGR